MEKNHGSLNNSELGEGPRRIQATAVSHLRLGWVELYYDKTEGLIDSSLLLVSESKVDCHCLRNRRGRMGKQSETGMDQEDDVGRCGGEGEQNVQVSQLSHF